ncbi:OmpA family protein [Flavobacterium psychrophilum]|uniref:OmpA family protein n=1 Tax=Flavobacterium psychrophilum TaxID=96345 RepID=UPI000B7C42D6|nr:OmpA family protein [Flavobacterium psychrophilum]MCB6232212.1 OmpA family protein [Flavobacterium psychrophilum]SNA88136.1 putative outer membrane protein, OmpA family [Flavobacterium psychrophilum]
MKNILKTITLLLICFCANAQTGKLDKANKQYENLAYIDAAKTYEKVAEKGYKSVDLFEKLGDSYYFNAKLKEANKWYKELFALNEKVEPEYYYRYSQTLKAVEDYANADVYMERFRINLPGDNRAKLYNDQKDYKEVIAKNSGRYEVKPTKVNTKMSDYGSAILGDKLIFASSRDHVGLVKSSSKWTEEAFTDLYAADKSEDGTLSNPKKFSNSVNSKFHEDSPVFTNDMKTVYFTRNNYKDGKTGKDDRKVILLKLYKATLIGGKWQDITELPFNSDQYSVAHPALSPDNKTLYFASNMPGSKGQSDIFAVSIISDNTYGTPVNLAKINTEGRETFPFVTSDNELYFASDGHQGLGGLDVFATKLTKSGLPGQVINVGAPVNGPMDDFSFMIEKPSRTGYFSSNREGGLGLDDIYYFKENEAINLDSSHLLEGIVTNSETGEILDNAKVTIYDEEFNPILSVTTDDKGYYTFAVEQGKKYHVRAEKDEYETKELPVAIPRTPGKTYVPIATAKKIRVIKVGSDIAKALSIKMIYFDLNKSVIRKDASVELAKILTVLNLNPTIKIDIRSHTDSRQTAAYNMSLSDRRAKSTIEWLVQKGISPDRLTGRGYGESQLVNECSDGVNCTGEQHQLNRRSEFIIISM